MKNILTTFKDFNYDISKSAVNDLIKNKNLDENDFFANRINLVENSVISACFNSYTNYADIIFLYSYSNFIFSNWFIYLETNGEFENKDNLSQFIDISNSILSVTLHKYSETNLVDALQVLIYNCIRSIIPDFKFVIYLTNNNEYADDSRYNISIDAILQNENKVDTETAVKFANYITKMFSFYCTDKKYCTLFFIASNSWISDIDNEDIFVINTDENNYKLTYTDDQIITLHLLTLKRAGFESEYERLSEEYNLEENISDLNIDDMQDNKNVEEYNNEIVNNQTLTWINYLEPYFNSVIPYLYKYININQNENNAKNSLVSIIPFKRKNTLLPLFKHIHDSFWCGENTNTKHNIYDDIANFYNAKSSNLISNGLDKFFKMFSNAANSNDKEITNTNENIENIENIEITENPYIEWCSDCSKLEITKTVLDFKLYINDMVKLYKKDKKDINKEILNKIAQAYSSDFLSIKDISNNNAIFTIDSIIGDKSFLFTFDENNDKIMNIKYKP